jgi:hypothetical protein
MSTISTSTLPTARRSALLPWALTGLAAAAVVILAGNTGVDHSAGEHGGLADAAVTAGVCLALAGLVFGVLLPRVHGGTRTQVVLAVASVLTLPVFWSGIPAVLGAAAAATGRRSTGSFNPAGWTGIAVIVLVVVWSLVGRLI